MRPMRLAAWSVCISVAGVGLAHGDVRVDFLGHWGGGAFAIKVRDGLAYVGIGPRLVILDVHDRAHPFRVGQTEPLGYYVTDIAVDGPHAYVVTYYGDLSIIDVADP